MDHDLIIYGASGHGKVVADTAIRAGYNVLGFADDDKSKKKHFGLDVKPLDNWLSNVYVFPAIGNNIDRQKIFNFLIDQKRDIPNIIDPKANISKFSKISQQGVLICAGAIIGADACIENGVILNHNCTVDHDCIIEEFSHICPGVNLAGKVKVEKEAWVGIGSSVLQEINIGSKAIVGAGSVVIKNVRSNITVCGNPAKEI